MKNTSVLLRFSQTLLSCVQIAQRETLQKCNRRCFCGEEMDAFHQCFLLDDCFWTSNVKWYVHTQAQWSKALSQHRRAQSEVAPCHEQLQSAKPCWLAPLHRTEKLKSSKVSI